MINRITLQGFLVRGPYQYYRKNDPTIRCWFLMSYPIFPIYEKMFGYQFVKTKADLWTVFAFGKAAEYTIKNANINDTITVDGQVFQMTKYTVAGERRDTTYIKASTIYLCRAISKSEISNFHKFQKYLKETANGKNDVNNPKGETKK